MLRARKRRRLWLQLSREKRGREEGEPKRPERDEEKGGGRGEI